MITLKSQNVSEHILFYKTDIYVDLFKSDGPEAISPFLGSPIYCPDWKGISNGEHMGIKAVKDKDDIWLWFQGYNKK